MPPLGTFLHHSSFTNWDGYCRVEFDSLACGDHLAWGYVDHPPLVPFLIKLSRILLGDSLRSIRIVPALATSAAAILSAMIARELGGRRVALARAPLSFLPSPTSLTHGTLATANTRVQLPWSGSA